MSTVIQSGEYEVGGDAPNGDDIDRALRNLAREVDTLEQALLSGEAADCLKQAEAQGHFVSLRDKLATLRGYVLAQAGLDTDVKSKPAPQLLMEESDAGSED